MSRFSKPIFQDPELQRQLEAEGFVKIPLLNDMALQEFSDFYAKELDGFQTGDFLHTHVATEAIRLKTHEYVQPRLKAALADVLVDYRVDFGFYMIKPKNGTTPMRVHQDKTMVDETKHVGLTVWCPLVDVDGSNGCLSIVRKSHLFLNNPRGTNIEMPYKRIEDLIETPEFSEFITVKRGEAVLFDHALWHGSTSNVTDKDRVVVAAVVTPLESEYVHYELSSSGKSISMYSAGVDFAVRFDVNGSLPEDCVLVRDDISPIAELHESDFVKMYRKHNPKEQSDPIWKRVLNTLTSK